MSDKSIDIHIAATGGDQAAEEIKKPAEAAKEAAEAAKEATAETKRAAEETAAAEREAAEAEQEGAEKARRLAEDLDGILAIQRAQAISELAIQFGEVGRQIGAAAKEVRDFNPELADTLETAGKVSEKVSSAVGAIATASALNPVAGAVVGLGIGLRETAAAWVEMEQAQANSERSAAAAVEMQRQLASTTEESVAAAQKAADEAEALATRYDRETDALRSANEETSRRNRLLAAKDAADAARRDLSDDAAVKGGAAPENVKAQRALDDAAREKARIDSRISARAIELQAEFERNRKERAEIERLKREPGNDAEKIAERESRLTAAESENSRGLLDHKSDSEAGFYQKRAIDDRASRRVNELAEAKQRRLIREQVLMEREIQQEQEAAQRERQREEQERVGRERQQERQEAGQGREAAGIGQKAMKLLPDNVTSQFRNAVTKAAARLQDGDQDGELRELAELLNKLAGSTNDSVKEIRNELQQTRKRCEILTGQIRNIRGELGRGTGRG